MARYPSDDSRFARWFRPLNLLDDIDNKLSPVKFNLWAANGAAFFAAVHMLAGSTAQGAMQLASVVGPYWAGSHVWHQADKRLNRNGGNGNGH